MSKKRKRSVPVQPKADRTAKARGVVWRQSGDAKYSRAKAKRAWRKQLRQEGASRGSFLFVQYCNV